MKTLILTIVHSCESPHAVFEYSLQLHKEADLAQCLERVRGALFLTGLAVQNAEVIDDDSGCEWTVSSDLLQRLVGPLFKHRRSLLSGAGSRPN
jgi:hypothetical protein